MSLGVRLVVLAAGCAVLVACIPTSPADSGNGDGGTAGAAGGSASGGSAGTGGGAGGAGGGAGGAGGGTGGAGGGTPAGALPLGTLLYVRSETKDHDVLVARDLAANSERVITDLRGDGSQGWEIDSYALSPDRRRVALASLYGPTAEDTATGLATRRIWNLAVDGTDFRRVTPVFKNTGVGKNTFQIDIGEPFFTQDGSKVGYGYGEYWWEGTTFKGGSFPWLVAADGSSLPSSLTTSTDCAVIHGSRNPATGDLLFIHSVCIPGTSEVGLYLYPEGGGTNPARLVGRATDGVDPHLTTPSWLPDGSGFLFIGQTNDQQQHMYMYDMSAHRATALFDPPAGASFYGVAIAPDASKIVYCLWDDETQARDLHVIDLAPATPTDSALTTDGKSCQPSF